MASFSEHIEHAKKNVVFLSTINSTIEESWDWQVTVCFYTALHLINAHIVQKSNFNYISHGKVDEIINPYNTVSPAKLGEDIYTSYTKLFQLSRRSRYLLNDNFNRNTPREDVLRASFTYSKHLKKAIHHLDLIIHFINVEYSENFPLVDIKCLDLNGKTFKYFKIVAA